MKKPRKNIWWIPFHSGAGGFISEHVPKLSTGAIEFTPVRDVKLKVNNQVEDIDVTIKDGVIIVSAVEVEDDFEEVIIGYYCITCGNDQGGGGDCVQCGGDQLDPVYE